MFTCSVKYSNFLDHISNCKHVHLCCKSNYFSSGTWNKTSSFISVYLEIILRLQGEEKSSLSLLINTNLNFFDPV